MKQTTSLLATGSLPRLGVEEPATKAPTLRDYAWVTAGLLVYDVALYALVVRFGARVVEPRAALAPLLAQVLLVLPVWLSMLIARNYAILTKLISGTYFLAFKDDPPPDWVERPARTFNNLMQLPTLFYLACVLMFVTGRIDAAQVALAWCFVALRILHAVVYIGWNHLPTRFGSYVAGFITLTVIFWRFAAQAWDLLAPG